MEKSLDRKLKALRANPQAKEFILADAKDADMAFGIGAGGLSPEAHPGEVRFRTLREYRDAIREIVRQELVDIMLMSASTNEVLTMGERIFDDTTVTPAARANDTTDIFVVRGGRYLHDRSRPFRSATLDHIQCGHLDCDADERALGADLGLYSVTFTNDTAADLATLEAFREFRLEAERKQFRYFLEVFDPNVDTGLPAELVGRYVNDMIARCLAGVVGASRPQFLKIVYHGPQAMEELFRYDPTLIIGILGGSAGTTYDAFKLLAEAQKYGARVALFGRKINGAENQFAFIRFLRLIADGVISPEEAVHAYHGVLQRLGIRPHRPLEEDLTLQTGVMSYGGSGVTVSHPRMNPDGSHAAATQVNATACRCQSASASTNAHEKGGCGCPGKRESTEGTMPATKSPAASSSETAPVSSVPKPAPVSPRKPAPAFATMTSAERLAYHRKRIARQLGEHPADD